MTPMPELPEVETVRRGLAPVMEGARMDAVHLARADLRFPFAPDFAERLAGANITALRRRAKYLLMEMDNGAVAIMHLGMSGSFRIVENGGEAMPGDFAHPRNRDQAHDHVRFEVTAPDGRSAHVIYNDPRRFGFMLLTEREGLDAHPSLAGLGVEPTGNQLSADFIAQRLAGRQVPLKAALLDQRIIAGLGNIYVCEALWRAKLSPRRKAATLVHKDGKPTKRLEALLAHVRDVIAEAILAGGSSLRDHAKTDGSLGYFQHNFAVYDREGEPCPCDKGAVIGRIVQSGRSTFYCPRCQR